MKAMADGKGKDTDERGKAVCAARGGRQPLPYWCEVCERAVPEKRCPYCGLKAKRIR
jgi:predicted RNA-binding protein with PUA domain